MSIFSRLFKSRDKLKTVMTARHTHTFSDERTAANVSQTEQPCSILWFMPVCVCCQKRLHSCHCICTNITIKEKSECHGIRFIFCSTISQILK